MATPEQKRYEAIFRALGRPVMWGLLLCVGTSILILVVFLLSLRSLVVLVPPDWPPPLGYAALMAPFGLAFVLLPSLSQLLIVNGRLARAIEALNVFALGEVEQYTAATGRKPPTLRNPGHARRWLAKHEGFGTRFRTRALIWAGELNAASDVIAGMPSTDSLDALHRSLLRQELEFVATGTMDLAESAAVLEMVPPAPARDHAIASLAFERSRLELARGGDHLAPLADARASFDRLPSGASVRDRFIASVRTTFAIFAVVAVLAFVYTLL